MKTKLKYGWRGCLLHVWTKSFACKAAESTSALMAGALLKVLLTLFENAHCGTVVDAQMQSVMKKVPLFVIAV